MGASFSIQTAVNNIVNNTINSIDQKATGSALAECSIKVNSFSFTNSTNCVAKVSNYCKADASVNMDSIIKAATQVYNDLSVDQKQGVPALLQSTFGISTTVNNVQNKFETYIKQECSSEAIAKNNLTFDTIVIDGCVSTGAPITFEFLNTGTASAMCVMKALTELTVQASNEVVVEQKSGIDINALMWPVVIIVAIIAGLYVVFSIVTKKIRSTDDEIKLLKFTHNTYASRIGALKELMN